MPEKKKQHYVPQFYIRNFTNDGIHLTLITVDGRIFPSVSYKGQCCIDYFYQNVETENQIGMLESASAPIIKKIISMNYSSFTVEEKEILKKFALYQYFRTDFFIKFTRKTSIDTAVETMKSIYPEGIPKDVIEKIINKSKEYEISPEDALYLAEKLRSNFSDLAIGIVSFRKKHQLISSDNPVLLINNFYKQNVGLEMAGLVLLLPLSPYKLLIIYDDKMYYLKKEYGVTKESKYLDSLTLNRMQLYNSNKIAYYYNEDFSINVMRQLKSARKAKKDKLDEIVCGLGTEENKMIVLQGPWCLLDTSLSFLKLNTYAEKIKLCNRDFFPRKPDESWVKRLDILKELPKIISKVNPAEEERDYGDMIRFIKAYWGIT